MFKTTMAMLLASAPLVQVGYQELVRYFFDEPNDHERERLIKHELETRDTPVIVVETESGLFFRFLAREVFNFGEDAEGIGRVYDTLAEEAVYVTAQDLNQDPWQG